ncbi:MAG: hypothetical protein RIQ56_930 [Candidatus Parcubacteria bacterium]|jgi:uncharacterized membrane protein
METFSIGAAVRFGWEIFKKRPLFFAGMTVLIGLISWVIGAFVGALTSASSSGGVAFIAFVLNLVLSSLLNMGIISYALKAHDAPDTVSFEALWNPQQFLNYLIMTLLVFVCVGIGFILLIVPGVIIALMLMFAPYLVIDRGLAPLDAMKESKRITDGHKMTLALFALALFGLNLLGALAVLLGLLVTIPVTMLAIAHAYRHFEHKAGEMVAKA